MKQNNVLIDTSIVLDGIHNVGNIDKNANVFVTDVVLRELDGNKGAEGSKGYNAREFFRQLNNHNFTTLDRMPLTENAVLKDDTLTEGEIDSGAHIFTLSRKWYRAKDINDTKIIEIAKDYDLTLKTLDQAQCVRAKSQGLNGEVYNKESNLYLKYNTSTQGFTMVNTKAILSITATIMIGLPLLVISQFSMYIGIAILLVLVISILSLIIGDNEAVEFHEKNIDKFKNEQITFQPKYESNFQTININPTTGLPMYGAIDAGGNVYGGSGTH